MYNSVEVDLSHLALKYTSRKDLFRNEQIIADINEHSICQSTIDAYRKFQTGALDSLQYLQSESYRNIVSDHRITLLFHIIDGICDLDSQTKNALLNEIKQKFISSDTIVSSTLKLLLS